MPERNFSAIMRLALTLITCLLALTLQSCDDKQKEDDEASLKACVEAAAHAFPASPADRADRFAGKVEEYKALCRGGQRAVKAMGLPWVDWGSYFGTGDASQNGKGVITSKGPLAPQQRGLNGALIDLETQRVGLIRFNLFENSGTYREYIVGRDGKEGPALKSWTPFNLPKEHPDFAKIKLDKNGGQYCSGDLVRARTLTGICNDVRNPLMGSTGMLFARNVEFETTFPDLGLNPLVKARHGERLGLLKPDPQVISRRLLTRVQSHPELCNEGFGLPNNDVKADCDYQKAPFFNVIAAFWIQFMTHDWFSHMEEGQNDTKNWMQVGCSEEDATKYGCRPGDRIDRSIIAQDTPPETFKDKSGREYLSRAPKTIRNTNTAWWDSSQIYGYDETSVKRVKRDPADPSRLLLVANGPEGRTEKFLPLLQPGDPMLRDWAGQEATAFPDNYTIGISFLTNLFAREHNSFVDEFRRRAAATPNADSGLRNPSDPKKVIRYSDVTPEELYQVARLVVAAEIAKIHTIEWTPQLLYNEPLYIGMNGNWNGLVGPDNKVLTDILRHIVEHLGQASTSKKADEWYSVFASGPGIFGIGSEKHHYDISDPDSLNAGVNHFGSAFNFPEEFITVYRLHSLIPDLIEYRETARPNAIVQKVPVIETFRGKSTPALRERGMANWALSFGRQRLGLLALGNAPQFMQNLRIERLQSETKRIDLVALDLIRDREHGVPRFNEFRRQYGLRTLTTFDDFIDPNATGDALARQKKMVSEMRDIYGQHTCDAGKIISTSQKVNGAYINDCFGKPTGTTVDNIEDVDTVVGWLAEPVRPHGFAISETQFVVFILNASRRLFSDRFLTSGFRPEFYSALGIQWVNDNGPTGRMYEPNDVNGHKYPVSPLKRVLMRNIPELKDELSHVINAFDPWARDRGEYYSLDWKPRPDAKDDPAFRQ